MTSAEMTARILAPIWQGFFFSELINREIQKEIEKEGLGGTNFRQYSELLEASDYLKRRGLEFDSVGLRTVLGPIGGKPYIWPWCGDLSEAFTQTIRGLFARNPKLEARAEAAGMGLSSLDKLNRDIQQQNENVKRLQGRKEKQATA
jgi:hypothetical protein